MSFEPKTLTCTDCGTNFIFSVGEQQFFAQRNLTNIPKRCSSCRLSMRYARAGRDVSVLSDVTCAQCHQKTRVPFKPRGHRPVYCNDCHAARRSTNVATRTIECDQDILQLSGLA